VFDLSHIQLVLACNFSIEINDLALAFQYLFSTVSIFICFSAFYLGKLFKTFFFSLSKKLGMIDMYFPD